MYDEIRLKYIHPSLNMGMENIKSVWLLSGKPVKLQTVVHRGSLAYRLPFSGKRISYKTLKKGLIKKTVILRLPLSLLAF